MKELVLSIVKCLVDNEENVQINEVETPESITYTVSVAQTDIGKVIGKEGRNAQAIRTIMKAASKKHNRKYMFDLVVD